MQVHITARHLDLTPAIADYVQKRLDRVERHFPAVLRAQVILNVEKHRHMAEIVTHANGHHDFRAKGVAEDLYAAVDLVVEKLHKHLARTKDKRVRGRRRAARVPEPAPSLIALPTDGSNENETLAPPITRIKRFTPQIMTVTEAVEEMERLNGTFIVFSTEDIVNVLYKRKDKTYGLLELNG